MAYTLSIQQALLTQLPLTLVFRWELLIVITIMALFCAIFASLIPIYTLTQNSIVFLLKS